MRGGKCRMVALDVMCCLSDGFKIAYYCILRFLIVQEGNFVCVCKVTVNTLNRLDDMFEVSGMRRASALLIP